MKKDELGKSKAFSERKRLEMKWIDIVGVRFHGLHSHVFKTLKLFINILMSTHKFT